MNLFFIVLNLKTHRYYYMISTTRIARALKYKGMLTVKSFIKVTKYEIDTHYVDLFWGSLRGESWIYMSPKLIDMIGFEGVEQKTRTSNCMRLLKKIAEINTEYKLVPSSHELVIYTSAENKSTRGGHNKKYYIVSPRCFKKLLMKANTQNSDRVYNYYLDLEDLFILYVKYECAYRRVKYEDEIKQITQMPHIKQFSRVQEIASLDLKVQEKNKLGIVYFIHEEGDLNCFKIGATYNVRARVKQLQCSNRRKLCVYKTIYAVAPLVIESIIHAQYQCNKILGEWFEISRDEVNEITRKYSF